MELKIFTLPACPTCPMAKIIASEVARKFSIDYREVSMASKEGLDEGLAYDVCSAPSIVLDEEVIVRGQLISKERLEEEVKKRLENWSRRASFERATT